MEYEDLNSVEEWHLTDSFTSNRYTQICRSIKFTPKKILDIGIGSGIGGKIMRLHFPSAEISGIDAVRERTRNLLHSYDRIFYGSILDKVFEPEFFDLVVAGELIEHIHISEVDNFLKEVFKILRPGGSFVFTTPNPNDIKLRLRRGSVLGGSHLSQHFIMSTRIRMQLASFRVVKVRGTGKTSKFIGTRFPKFIYGSYLLVAQKR
jgi:2-polyprenyl-3-methyl-5-hydroxy-6-metoxy-1,4-benzoquinol methylase